MQGVSSVRDNGSYRRSLGDGGVGIEWLLWWSAAQTVVLGVTAGATYYSVQQIKKRGDDDDDGSRPNDRSIPNIHKEFNNDDNSGVDGRDNLRTTTARGNVDNTSTSNVVPRAPESRSCTSNDKERSGHFVSKIFSAASSWTPFAVLCKETWKRSRQLVFEVYLGIRDHFNDVLATTAGTRTCLRRDPASFYDRQGHNGVNDSSLLVRTSTLLPTLTLSWLVSVLALQQRSEARRLQGTSLRSSPLSTSTSPSCYWTALLLQSIRMGVMFVVPHALFYYSFVSSPYDSSRGADGDGDEDDEERNKYYKYKSGIPRHAGEQQNHPAEPPEPQHHGKSSSNGGNMKNSARESSTRNGGDSSSTSSSSQQQQQQQPAQRYLELLVHNVSHTDMVLGLDFVDPATGNWSSTTTGNTSTPQAGANVDTTQRTTAKDEDEKDHNKGNAATGAEEETGTRQAQTESPPTLDEPYWMLCRPRFSCFAKYSCNVLQLLQQQQEYGTNNEHSKNPSSQNTLIYFPRYERSTSLPRLPICPRPTPGTIPTGFQLQAPPSTANAASEQTANDDSCTAPQPVDLGEVRLRGRDQIKQQQQQQQQYCDKSEQEQRPLYIRHVFFPLLANLLPRWQRRIHEKLGHREASNNHDNNGTSQATTTTSSCSSCGAVKRVLILVTGVGTPRNWTHSVTGNSTRAAAACMERFVRSIDLDNNIAVVHIHSDAHSNIFRYDENLLFCERQLLPTIHAYRDAHARGLPYPDEVAHQQQLQIQTSDDNVDNAEMPPFNPDWRKSFDITLSFADGSPARTYAIQASLRSYKPTYFHFWQLKTFWHESKIVEDDLEVHSFAEMETIPAVDVSQQQQENSDTAGGGHKSSNNNSYLDPHVRAVLAEIKAFKAQMVHTLQTQKHDMDTFWLRKTHKPVLAVLLVQSSPNGPIKLYRGTNMEVSMPTGSLCAERNVIGTALADNPALQRQDLKLIAVLAVPLVVQQVADERSAAGGMKRVPSVASYSSIIQSAEHHQQQRAAAQQQEDRQQQQQQQQLREGLVVARKISVGSELDSPADDEANSNSTHDSDWVMTTPDQVMERLTAAAAAISNEDSRQPRQRQEGQEPQEGAGDGDGVKNDQPATATASGGAPLYCSASVPPACLTPRRHIALYSKTPRRTSLQSKRTVVVHSDHDLNPLAPCGACNEWLKKIAASNPYFRILTFTDADCNGMYVTPCQD